MTDTTSPLIDLLMNIHLACNYEGGDLINKVDAKVIAHKIATMGDAAIREIRLNEAKGIGQELSSESEPEVIRDLINSIEGQKP